MTTRRPFRLQSFLALVLAVALAAGRLMLPERGLDTVGPRAIADGAFAVALLVLLLYSARGLGRLCLRRLGLADVEPLVGLVFALAIGVGIVGSGILALGLIGLLKPPVVFAFVAAALAVGWRETQLHGHEWGDARGPFRGLSAGRKLGLAAAGVIFTLSLAQALTPVWDYDGLMYHLQAPALFLRAGRLMLLPELWQANGPLLTEMLYLIGLAAGSQVFSKVVHLTLAAVLILATFAIGRRHAGERTGWLAGGILLGVPILPVWGSLAYADMGWALFEVLAIAGYLEWRESPRRAWLIVSGALLGLAMGSKYTALAMFPVMILAILVDPAASGRRLRSMLWLGGASLLVSVPWYLKNLIWSGNPLFPFLIGGPSWGHDRLALLMTYLQSFGTGKSVLDYLLLPISLYTRRDAFGTFMSRIDIPSPLFLLALAFPLLPRRHPLRPLGLILLLRFGLWAVGTQQTRFLLPLYPVLSLLVAGLLDAWLSRPAPARWHATAVTGIVAGMVGVTLAYQAIYFDSIRPLPVLSGQEAEDGFLRRSVYDYAALRYVTDNLGSGDRVLMAWDGQGYYCDDRCLPDAEQSQWARLVQGHATPSAMTAYVRALGVTHVLVDLEGMSFLLQHDPTGAHRLAARFLTESYAPACLAPIFSAPKVTLFLLRCQ